MGTNSRKRGRELTETAPSINPFSLQSQPHQLIDLSQLHTPQQNVVSTGLRLAFGEQQQLQQKQKQQQTLFPQSSVLFSLLPEDFAAQIRQQRDEIDQFLGAQVLISLFPNWLLCFSHFIMIEAEQVHGGWRSGRAPAAHVS